MEEFNKFSYLAGYVDGDGCFYLGTTIQKPKNIIVYESSIQILSVKPEVLYFFKENFGGYVRQKPQKLNHKTPYVWTIKNKFAFDLAKLISDHLTDKKISSQIFIKMAHRIKPNCGISISIEEHEIRLKIINAIREEKSMNDFIDEEFVQNMKNTVQCKTPTSKDFAYFAGLMDSEGCFRIKTWKPKTKPNKVYAISIEIGNTRKPIFPFLIETFGGSIQYIHPKSKNKKPFALWTLSADALFKILPNIYPYLISKKEVCAKLIEFQKTILSNGGDRHSESFRILYEKTRIIRDKIIEEVHLLNSKGS